MTRPRSAVRKVREILRLSLVEGLNPRQIGKSLGIARTTVRRTVERADQAAIAWPLPSVGQPGHLTPGPSTAWRSNLPKRSPLAVGRARRRTGAIPLVLQ